ncbi:hypothetical protein [Pelobacter propionicus]|uniref:hypothetical protein n=1 Tax=Pelobacter propionicus TaxID=29543 RepID=UPI0005A1362B|nr:hypothetical protein [Pelobacter propionicus]
MKNVQRGLLYPLSDEDMAFAKNLSIVRADWKQSKPVVVVRQGEKRKRFTVEREKLNDRR